jgi:hypothetical protein
MCSLRYGLIGGDGVFGDRFAALLQVPDEPGQRAQIMKDQAVGHKMVVLDRLALLVPTVFSDDSFTAEESPSQKAVQGFPLIGRALDKRTQFLVGNIAQQKASTNDATQLTECLVKAVLAAIVGPGISLSQPGWGVEFTTLHRSSHGTRLTLLGRCGTFLRSCPSCVGVHHEKPSDVRLAHLFFGLVWPFGSLSLWAFWNDLWHHHHRRNFACILSSLALAVLLAGVDFLAHGVGY